MEPDDAKWAERVAWTTDIALVLVGCAAMVVFVFGDSIYDVLVGAVLLGLVYCVPKLCSTIIYGVLRSRRNRDSRC